MIPLKDLAIKKALENDWNEAIQINQKILDENPTEIDTLNRLAFALIKIGKYRKARETYKLVISLDKTNPIATKNIRKIDSIAKQHIKGEEHDENGLSGHNVNIQDVFIEEAGKTKTVELKNIADKKTLSIIQPGDQVSIIIKRSKIFIQFNNKYIGMLPDSVGARLIPFIKGGNQYQAYIRSVSDKCVFVFVKEVKKSSRYKNQLSFNTTSFVYSKD